MKNLQQKIDYDHNTNRRLQIAGSLSSDYHYYCMVDYDYEELLTMILSLTDVYRLQGLYLVTTHYAESGYVTML